MKIEKEILIKEMKNSPVIFYHKERNIKYILTVGDVRMICSDVLDELVAGYPADEPVEIID